jgi:hypothetical protein
MDENGVQWPVVQMFKDKPLLALTAQHDKPKPRRIWSFGQYVTVGGAGRLGLVAVDAQGKRVPASMGQWAKHITKAENTLSHMFRLLRARVIPQAEWNDAYGDSGSPAKRKALKEKYQDTPVPTAADRALGGDQA